METAAIVMGEPWLKSCSPMVEASTRNPSRPVRFGGFANTQGICGWESWNVGRVRRKKAYGSSRIRYRLGNGVTPLFLPLLEFPYS